MNTASNRYGELSEWSKVQHSKSRWRKSTAMPYSPYFTRFSAMCLVSNFRSSNTNSNTFIISGELSEWSKVQHSKCCVLTKHPGFESLTLRHKRNVFCLPRQKAFFFGSSRIIVGLKREVNWWFVEICNGAPQAYNGSAAAYSRSQCASD